MQLVPTNYTVSDYTELFEKGDVRINRDYQRLGGQWPPQAKSFFLETMLLGYPIPKIYLYSVADPRTRRVVREIVDGQQRTEAIVEFLKDDFRLTSNIETLELRGKSYNELSDEFQQTFFSYPLPIDLFTAATPDEIREIFRRINSYTSPLNAEEKRHAKYQGAFKWFANNLAKELAGLFEALGVFSQKAFIRMGDLKLITEWVYTFENGIRTTKGSQLDSVYRDFDDQFTKEPIYSMWIRDGLRVLVGVEQLKSSDLTKPHMFYALLLACIHLQRDVRTLHPLYNPAGFATIDQRKLGEAIQSVLDILEDENALQPKEFLDAARAGTNVKDAREIRFKFLCEALRPAFS